MVCASNEQNENLHFETSKRAKAKRTHPLLANELLKRILLLANAAEVTLLLDRVLVSEEVDPNREICVRSSVRLFVVREGRNG